MLNENEKKKYNRQLMLDDFGLDGQERLKQARVLVAGAGGLGSPISIYLAAAGVGTIRIVDKDVVSLSNLNRQILYDKKDIGGKKSILAGNKLRRLNPDIKVEAIAETIDSSNVSRLAADFDIIMDATDNFQTRYLLNEAALKIQIPFIYGGIYGMEGALTTIIRGQSACLKCIFPSSLPPLSSCQSPVLGATAGIIGCLQAMEAIKYLSHTGELLLDRLLIFDGLYMNFRKMKLNRNPECPDCGRFIPRKVIN